LLRPPAAPRHIERFSDVDVHQGRRLIEYLDLVTHVSADDKARTFAAQNVRAGMHVLDVGCGTGDDVRTLSKLVGDSGRVAGIDASNVLIEEARSRGVPNNASFEVAKATELPFGEAAFDAVRAERVVQHLREPEVAACEMRRVLKTGGTALLLDQDWESLCIAGADRGTTRAIVRALADGLANAWAGRDARGLLRRAGFGRVDVAPLVAMPVFPLAFQLILQPAADAALTAGVVDAETARQWLLALAAADGRGEFFCAAIVVVAVAHAG
jgi:SAM-dependent methyltransferase